MQTKSFSTLEQQIKALGFGTYAIQLNNNGRLKMAVVTVPTNVRVQVMIQVIGTELGAKVCKTYKVKGDGICLIGTQVPNESFNEVWDTLIKYPKGQVMLN